MNDQKPQTKQCTNCEVEKSFCEFNKNKRGKYGLHSYCRECDNRHNRENYINNHEYFLKQHKIYRDNHKEERKEYAVKNKKKLDNYMKDYRENNKDKLNEYYRNKRLIDFNHKILSNLRRRINKVNKSNMSTKELIGCSKEFLNRWLHSTIEENNNLVLDHIKPLNIYDLSNNSEQYKANNWRNLRLTSKNDNTKKGTKRDPILEAQYIIKAKQFEELFNQNLY